MQHTAVEVVPVAVEVDLAVAEQGPDDGERLLEPADTVVVCEAECVVLATVPPGTEPEDQTTARDRVDGRRLLGQHRRCVEAGRCHERSDLDRRGRGRDRRQRRPDLPRAAIADLEFVEQVVAEPERVEPDRLGGLRHCDQLRERNLPLHLGELDTDPHPTFGHRPRLANRPITDFG